MIKKYVPILLSILVILSITISGATPINAIETGQYVKEAETLKVLGLFLGTTKGFELSRVANRAEAAVMLVRLLGVEQVAFEQKDSLRHPFKDVPNWASPYVAYLYEKGLVKGVRQDEFGSWNSVKGNDYLTMLLRALGYSDSSGQFAWENAMAFASGLSLVEESEITIAKEGALRDKVVKWSYDALFVDKYGTGKSLLQNLMDERAVSPEKVQGAATIDERLVAFSNVEMRAVWVTYLELKDIFKVSKTEQSFKQAISNLYDEAIGLHLNTVIVQVRPFGDAIYPSTLFPWSYIITGAEGVAPSYDPLKVMVDVAHQKGLRFEAWLNPYRLRSSGQTVAISDINIAKTWLTDNSNRVIQISEGTFFNPGSQEVMSYIAEGVREIVKNYPVDGIHFDDYFYPSTSMTYDVNEYTTYQQGGGLLSQAQWRRENINQLVKKVYAVIKTENPEVVFGISPQGSFEANYEQEFIDVARWVQNPGYVDYICPQIYYGYLHSKYPYAQLIEQWSNLITQEDIKLYIGLAAYKIGAEDKWAGIGKQEWITSKEILKNMVLDGRKLDHYSGFSLYRFDYIKSSTTAAIPQISAEVEALKSVLQ